MVSLPAYDNQVFIDNRDRQRIKTYLSDDVTKPMLNKALYELYAPGSTLKPFMAAAGLPEGDYTLGGLEVRVQGRDVRLVDSGSLAGGVSCLLDQVRWCVTDLGVPLTDAVRAASTTPARALALDGAGALVAGGHADVVVVDDELTLQRVMRRGAWL